MKRSLMLALTSLATLALGITTAAAASAAPAQYQAPAQLHAAKVLANSFGLGWNPEPGPGFQVQVSTGTGQQVLSLATSNDYATVSNLVPGQKYIVRVQVNVPDSPYAQVTVTTQLTFNQKIAAYVQTLEGIPYLYGGTTTQGFDCSGLAQYVYRHFSDNIQRTANEQFLEFRPESLAQSEPGDLVFFHATSNPASHVYHVGVYEGGENMVDSPHTGSHVRMESFAWAGNTVTFGTISH